MGKYGFIVVIACYSWDNHGNNGGDGKIIEVMQVIPQIDKFQENGYTKEEMKVAIGDSQRWGMRGNSSA